MHFGFRFGQLAPQGFQLFACRPLLLGQIQSLLRIIVLTGKDILQFLHERLALFHQLGLFLFAAFNGLF